MIVLNTSDIIGRTFIMSPQEDGQKFWVCIVNIIDDHETTLEQEPGHTKFICYVDDGQF